MLKGIDVSVWQGDIDWDAVKSAVSFAIIRSSHSGAIDEKFARNKAESRRVGILRGFYHYAYPQFNSDATADAQRFVNWVGDLQDGELLMLDIEEHWSGGWVQWAKTWLDEVYRLTGRRPVVYMNDNFDNMFDWTPVVNGNYGLVLAFWDFTLDVLPATDWNTVAFKQYGVGDPNTVAGIAGRIDLDVFYGNEQQFLKYGTPDGNVVPDVPSPAPVPAPAPQRVYTVQAGDTLWGIAQMFGTSVSAILAMNPRFQANPNLIHVGDQIMLDGYAPVPADNQYTVQRGDTLSGIAGRYGTTWQQLYEWNKGVIGDNPNLIKPSQVLRVK